MKENLYGLQFWRWLAAVWTVITLGLFVLDYFSQGKYDISTSTVGIIYIAVLTMFVGSKEFERWQRSHRPIFFGEIFIIVWTVLMIVLVIVAPLSEGRYKVSGQVVAVYTAVLTIFLITQKSKALSEKRK